MEDLDKVILEPSGILGTEITVDEIKARIAKLSGLAKDDLKGAMAELKQALRLNPEASMLLLPEEIGALTASIYKMTEQVVIASAAKTTTKASKKIDFTKLKEMPSDF